MEYYYKTLKKTVNLSPNITELDISHLSVVEVLLPPSLQKLFCSNNRLTDLDLSNCANLEIIYCQNNQLENLNIINCTKLKSLYCEDNRLKELLINSRSLEVLNCNNNKIITLDVSYCSKLVNLKCQDNQLNSLKLEMCIKLIRLICNDNKLTDLDVDYCSNLEDLVCNNNQLTILNIEKCENLKTIICTNNKLEVVEISNNSKIEADKNVKIFYLKNTPNFNQTEQQVSNLILKIKNPVLWSIADQLTRNIPIEDKETKFNIKEVKKLANSIPTLGQMLTKNEGSMLLKKHSNGFTILDIESLSFELENKDTLLQNKFIEIGHSTWDGPQRYFNDEINYVFQVNLKPFKNKEILDSHPNKNNLEYYINGSNHPTSRSTLTLAWVRYTYSKEMNSILLDEIQTDLTSDNYKLGDNLTKGWEEFTMKLFIQYVRKQYKVRKIYMPTYATRTDLKYYPKKDKDTKLPPMYLYKELPNKFGFKKNSDMDGFMVLENNLFESFKDYLQNNNK